MIMVMMMMLLMMNKTNTAVCGVLCTCSREDNTVMKKIMQKIWQQRRATCCSIACLGAPHGVDGKKRARQLYERGHLLVDLTELGLKQLDALQDVLYITSNNIQTQMQRCTFTRTRCPTACMIQSTNGSRGLACR